MLVLISIGNSDDKLTQREWYNFWRELDELIRSYPDFRIRLPGM